MKIDFTGNSVYTWVLVLTSILAGFYVWPLFDQDEAAYAGFAMNMLNSGNFLTPDFTWSDVHRKTPLHFWMIALCYKIFGMHTFVTRLPALFSIIGTCWLIWSFLYKQYSFKTANSAILILSGNFLLGLYARMSVTDGPLLFFQTWAAISLIKFIQTQKYKYAGWHMLALSLGMLQKGPAMLIFSGLLGIAFILFSKTVKILFRPKFISLQLISFIPIGLWGYLAWQRDNGTMIQWMLDWYVFNRIDGNVFGQTGPPGYHFAMICLTFLLLIPLLIFSIYHQFRNFRDKELSSVLFLIWALAAWIPLEFTSSKLPSYALGAYPAIAILMSLSLPYYKAIVIKWTFILNVVILSTMGLLIWLVPIPEIESVSWIAVIFLLSLTVYPLLILLLKKQNATHLLLLQNVCMIGIFCILSHGLKKQYNVTYEVATHLKTEQIDALYLDNSILYYPSLPLYLEWETGKKPLLISEELNNRLQNTTSETQVYILSKETINKIPPSILSDFSKTDFAGLNTGRGGMLNLSILRKKN